MRYWEAACFEYLIIIQFNSEIWVEKIMQQKKINLIIWKKYIYLKSN